MINLLDGVYFLEMNICSAPNRRTVAYWLIDSSFFYCSCLNALFVRTRPSMTSKRLIEIEEKMGELEHIVESCDSNKDEDVLYSIELELEVLIRELSSTTERVQLRLV